MFTFCTGRTKDFRGVWKKTTYFQPQQSLLNRGGGLRHTHLILISGAGHSRVGQGRIPTVSHCGDDSLLASRYEYNKQTHVQIGWSNNQDQIPSQPERLPKLKICGMFPKSTSPFLMNVFPGIIFTVSTALGRFWHAKFNSTKFFKSKVLKIILTNISKWNNNQKIQRTTKPPRTKKSLGGEMYQVYQRAVKKVNAKPDLTNKLGMWAHCFFATEGKTNSLKTKPHYLHTQVTGTRWKQSGRGRTIIRLVRNTKRPHWHSKRVEF